MTSPHKRPKLSPMAEDYVALGGEDEADNAARYGYDSANPTITESRGVGQQNHSQNQRRNAWNDPRNAQDRPKSKHALPGQDRWILIKTKYGRRFVHNLDTKESFWHIPQDIFPAVREFEIGERLQKEKDENAKWAEEQLTEMREKSKAEEVNAAARQDRGNRRRRSESLQREDEAAMMAELAAEAERAEEQDAKEAVEEVEALKSVPQQISGGYASDSSYEEVEVTDSEFEDDDVGKPKLEASAQEPRQDEEQDGPVEFGEDDIAYQLAAMEEDYDMDADEDEGEAGHWDEDQDEPPLTEDDAASLFRDMLDDKHISPFTPWDKLIADESDDGIMMDARYTALPNMRTRKEVWEAWVKDTAARLREERARMEKLDPKIPFLAFLADKATPKLYWPEFKRKYKRESEMNDRKLADKDREKLYRDHINRLKLPESTRKADLIGLLKNMPLRSLNKSTRIDALPQQVQSHLHFISLPNTIRAQVILAHLSGLPAQSDNSGEDGEMTDEQQAEEVKKRNERKRREQALADRARKVEEHRQKAEREERRARQDLRQEEQELRRAMDVGRVGTRSY